MTEKRFTLIKDTGTDECYSDNLYDNGTYIGAINGGSEMICYLLNAQHEEIQKLLTLNNMKKGALVEAVKDLIEENEQLKSELFESEKQYYMETYHDNPVRRDDKIEILREEFKERFGRDFE